MQQYATPNHVRSRSIYKLVITHTDLKVSFGPDSQLFGPELHLKSRRDRSRSFSGSTPPDRAACLIAHTRAYLAPQRDNRLEPTARFDASNQPCVYDNDNFSTTWSIARTRKPRGSDLPEIGKPVDTQDGQVLLRVIALWNLVDVMVPPASSQERPPVSERFRSLWVHGRLSSVEVFPGRPTVGRTCTRNPARIYMIIVWAGGSHASHHSVNRTS